MSMTPEVEGMGMVPQALLFTQYVMKLAAEPGVGRK
jgi:hypothetical protein